MDGIEKIDAKLEKKLNLLAEIPSRDYRKQEIGKGKLLSTAKYYQRPVSKSQNHRLKDRFNLKGLFKRKEPIPMLTQILAAILVVTGLVGGTGVGTAFASQYSLPGDTLYPVKLWTEDVRMDFAEDEETAFELDLTYADRRMDEMVALLEDGEEIPEDVVTKFQTHIDDALTKSVGLADPDKAFDRIQGKLLDHQDQIDQIQEKTQSLTMEKTQEMVQERLQVIEKVQQQTANKDQLREDQPEDRGPDSSNGNSENGSQSFCEGDADCAGQGEGAGQGDGTGQGESAGQGAGAGQGDGTGQGEGAGQGAGTGDSAGQDSGAGQDGESGQGQQSDGTGGQQQGGQGQTDDQTQGYGTQGTGGQGSGGSGGNGGGHQ